MSANVFLLFAVDERILRRYDAVEKSFFLGNRFVLPLRHLFVSYLTITMMYKVRIMRKVQVAIVVASMFSFTGCATIPKTEQNNIRSAPVCTPGTSEKTVVTEQGHDAMMLAACFWCKLNKKEREHFTKETEQALASAVSGDVVHIESPLRKDVYLVLNIEKVQELSEGNSCVEYTEIAHFEGNEVKYPKKVCFQDEIDASV